MDTDDEEIIVVATHDPSNLLESHEAAPDTESEGGEDDEHSISSEDFPALDNPIQKSQSLTDLENIDDSAANLIFEHVQTVLKSLSNDSKPETRAAIETLKIDYENLKAIVLESRDHTRNLAKRAIGMIATLADNSHKIKSVFTSSQADKSLIKRLRKDLKNSIAIAESSKKREEDYQESINELKNQVLLLRNTGNTEDGKTRDGAIMNYGKTKFLEMQKEYEDKLRKSIKVIIC